jgi:hypothetical protein
LRGPERLATRLILESRLAATRTAVPPIDAPARAIEWAPRRLSSATAAST